MCTKDETNRLSGDDVHIYSSAAQEISFDTQARSSTNSNSHIVTDLRIGHLDRVSSLLHPARGRWLAVLSLKHCCVLARSPLDFLGYPSRRRCECERGIPVFRLSPTPNPRQEPATHTMVKKRVLNPIPVLDEALLSEALRGEGIKEVRCEVLVVFGRGAPVTFFYPLRVPLPPWKNVVGVGFIPASYGRERDETFTYETRDPTQT